MSEDHSFALNPVQFFALSCDCFYLAKQERVPSWTTYSIPSTHSLTREETFAKLAIGWNEEGIGVQVQVNQPASESCYPQVEKGDSIELFFDTRNLKSAGFNTRFCHHFFFLPQAVEGVIKGEKTHFRTEDNHPLCDPQALDCQTQLRRNQYQMKIFIPTQCLYGYDPKQFNCLGFTYRINRHEGEPQHFSVISQEYQIDQQPSLWGSLSLQRE